MATPQNMRTSRAASTRKRLEELGVRIIRDGRYRRYDLTDVRFGRLVALHCIGKIRLGYHWHCRCDCGNKTSARVASLIDGTTQSCGCLQKDTARSFLITHGESHSAEHNVWCSMKNRCFNRSCKQYKDYGGRGITVAPDWTGIDGFQRFFAHVGRRPTPRHTIERIDNNGNYEPGNVKWAIRLEQNRNTRRNRYITYNGETKTISEWAQDFKISRLVLRARLDLGWPFVEAVTAPVKKPNRLIEYQGRKLTLKGWAKEIGIRYGTLVVRLRTMSTSEALALPSHKKPAVMLEHNGERLQLAEWARRTGISASTISRRIKQMGWSVEKAITTPRQRKRGGAPGRAPRPLNPRGDGLGASER